MMKMKMLIANVEMILQGDSKQQAINSSLQT